MATQTSPFAAPVKLLGVDLTAVDSTQKHELGLVALDQSGNVYQYVSASTEAITANSLVSISSTSVVTLADAANDRIDGFAPVAISLNSYGWVGIHGDFANVPVAADIALNDPFSVLALTAGQASGLPGVYSVTGSAARGVAISAPSGGTATLRFF